jgi:hypothetical protein
MTSFDALKEYYKICSNVTTLDFINILYNSNLSFKQTFKQILPKGTKKPNKKDIHISYQNFLSCQNLTDFTAKNIETINNDINVLYYQNYNHTYRINSLNESTY